MALTLARPVHSELLIKKSRFLGCVQPVAGRAEALQVVERLRAEHPGAAHVCWALLAGGQSAANDDGEPGGTAGRPMLEVLRHQHLEGVLAKVVRYFGGVKLGAGGLERAYTHAVAQALLQAEKLTLQRTLQFACRVLPAEQTTERDSEDVVAATDNHADLDAAVVAHRAERLDRRVEVDQHVHALLFDAKGRAAREA